MKQRRNVPIEAPESVCHTVLGLVAWLTSSMDEQPDTPVLDNPGVVGWIRVPPTIDEQAAEFIVLAWLSQGRSLPEA